MAFADIALSELVNAAPISPGLGGWDAPLNQAIADVRSGRFSLGLLSRVLAINPPNSSSGTTILTVPEGYYCIPTMLVVANASGAAHGAVTIDVHLGSGAMPATANFLDNFSISGISGSTSLVLAGRPANTAAYSLGDGDVSARSIVQIRKNTATTMSLNLWLFGHVFPKSDPA